METGTSTRLSFELFLNEHINSSYSSFQRDKEGDRLSFKKNVSVVKSSIIKRQKAEKINFTLTKRLSF